MSLLLIIFGLLSGCLLSVLVGLLGAQRTIGFGWAFLISLFFTPLLGLLCVLLSSPLYGLEPRRWGCLGVVLSILGVALFVPFLMFVVAFVTMLML